MADRNVSTIVQVGGEVRNLYLRAMQQAEERQKHRSGMLQDTNKQFQAVASVQAQERRLAELKRRQDAVGDSSEDLVARRLSPRLRGNRSGRADRRARAGTIPAPAGEPILK